MPKPSHSDLWKGKIIAVRYKLDKQLGNGPCAQVLLVNRLDTGEKFTVKRLL